MRKNPLNLVITGGIIVVFLALIFGQTTKKDASPSRVSEGGKPSVTKDLLATSGDYQITEDKVIFDFKLTNKSPEVQELQFGSGQQFELVIRDEKDEEVYRYSDGKFFTMALINKRINPGESLRWQDQWDLRDKTGKMVNPGRYRAEIEIMVIPEENREQIDERQLSATIEFLLPEHRQGDMEKSEETDSQEDPSLVSSFKEKGIIPSAEAKRIIAGVADAVIQALSAKDADKLASYVHPVKGVRFTPYTYVDPGRDQIFTPDQVRNLFKDQQRYLWGYYDGSGEEIKLTPGEYYEKFIYTADFINAEQIGYNQVLSSGNMLENQFEVYENPIIVEYYFSGFDPVYAGMDWQSLRLVFEEDGGEWRLTGMIHNQWTI